uniref:RAB11 binding and LisH domain, coiled-coil and HEAT repeat containing n=1 Tax=Rousettus aegyptiacus TaxID=9407 RepID=A0A7J8DK08_ROUAE|nr:RAB11 binding and LisH domain, coiled-coil and HEAT repeat containing [Rousettus aegyptiacus]
MAAMAPGGSGSGGGGVNPFLSDSDEDDDEVATSEERRAGLRLGSGGGLDPGSADSLSPQDPVALGSSARPGLPGESAAAAVALGCSGETSTRLSIDAIAAQLLRDQYLLTALELHTELLESGRELPRLRDYFSNPGNFERQSGTPPGIGAPGLLGAVGVGGAGGREPSTTSGGGQLMTRFPRPMSPLQDVATIIGSREQLAVLLQLYDYQLEHEGTTGWESLLWVVNQLLPQLIEIVGKINVTSTACVHEFSRFFWRLCRTFGKIFTNTKVKPQFQEILRLSEENIDSSARNGVLTKATVPIYATGVLTCYIQEEDRKLLVGFLEDVMTLLSLSHAPLDSLKASFVELGANPAYHELLLTVLWYGVVHTSALVRCTAARMFELLVKGVNETLVAQRVVPALITLSSDPEISVRIATIPAFGTIMETVIQRELLERVKMQLASFLEDPQYQDQYALHTEIIKTFGRVGPNAEPRFRDEFVLPHLHKLALVNNLQIVDSKRLDIATHLFEAYSALSCCFISEDLMVNHFLPGLRCLRTDMEHLSPEHEVILSSMIKECEQKVENKTVQEPQGSMSIAASLVSEDTKTKFLNKMGQLTTSGAMLANVFQRKK